VKEVPDLATAIKVARPRIGARLHLDLALRQLLGLPSEKSGPAQCARSPSRGQRRVIRTVDSRDDIVVPNNQDASSTSGAQSLEGVQPGEAALDYPALLAQAGAVRDAAAGDPLPQPVRDQLLDHHATRGRRHSPG
jgi:hypothetical protein